MELEKTETPERPRIFTRRRAAGLFAVGAVSAAACLANGFIIEPARLTVTRREIQCRDLPPSLSGLKICLLTDFHFLPGTNDELVDKVVAKVAREKPDLITLGGDYMNHDAGVLEPLLEKLGRMQCSHGIFAVMGNHDGWTGSPTTIRRQFEQAGISFLINQHSQIQIRGEKLAIAGTDHVWLGKPDPLRTLKGIPVETPIVALVHEPDFFDTMIGDRKIHLQLSGHTHGGQCRVPFVGYAPIEVDYGKNYVYGHFQRDDSNLFVSRGIGTTGMRVRFACPPEMAILTLIA